LDYLELLCYVNFQQPEPENERKNKQTASLTFTQQLQIARSNTMAGRHTTPDSSRYCVYSQERDLYSLEMEAEAFHRMLL